MLLTCSQYLLKTLTDFFLNLFSLCLFRQATLAFVVEERVHRHVCVHCQQTSHFLKFGHVLVLILHISSVLQQSEIIKRRVSTFFEMSKFAE